MFRNFWTFCLLHQQHQAVTFTTMVFNSSCVQLVFPHTPYMCLIVICDGFFWFVCLLAFEWDLEPWMAPSEQTSTLQGNSSRVCVCAWVCVKSWSIAERFVLFPGWKAHYICSPLTTVWKPFCHFKLHDCTSLHWGVWPLTFRVQ